MLQMYLYEYILIICIIDLFSKVTFKKMPAILRKIDQKAGFKPKPQDLIARQCCDMVLEPKPARQRFMSVTE